MIIRRKSFHLLEFEPFDYCYYCRSQEASFILVLISLKQFLLTLMNIRKYYLTKYARGH